MTKISDDIYAELVELCHDETVGDFVALLKQSNVDINDPEYDLGTVASAFGRMAILQALISLGLDVKGNKDILAEAAQNGHLDCVKLIIGAGAPTSMIKHSTAYTTHHEVKEFLDTLGETSDSWHDQM